MTQEPEVRGTDSVDPFSIDIALTHPMCDPVGISERLGLEPTYSWKRGDRFGDLVKQCTQWYGRLLSGSGAAEYERALEDVVSFLTKNEAFFSEFTKGDGEVEIVLNHAAGEQMEGVVFELNLSPVFLTQLARRDIGLRIQAWGTRGTPGQRAPG
jgi:hypothetical protein